MQTVFYIAGIFFFIFVGSILTEISHNLKMIATYLNKLLQNKG